jgi:hypothetical protein
MARAKNAYRSRQPLELVRDAPITSTLPSERVEVVGMRDDTAMVRHRIEVDRLSRDLADEFAQIAPAAIEDSVRAEFVRRSDAPVQDFVPIFVYRNLREKLRATR